MAPRTNGPALEIFLYMILQFFWLSKIVKISDIHKQTKNNKTLARLIIPPL